jgi:HSP20 family protein
MYQMNTRTEWSPFLTLRQEMDRIFDDIMAGSQEKQGESIQVWSPACDVVEDQDHFLVTLEMAGVPKDDIRIEVLNNQLLISGERKVQDRRIEKGLSYTERKFGKFQRVFRLPTGLHTDKIEADYKDGVLHVAIPKVEAERPRQIKIGNGSSSGFFSKLIGKEKSEPTTIETQKENH